MTAAALALTPDSSPNLTLGKIQLTDGQQAAYDQFITFLLDPREEIFVLSGYSGTGKTTWVRAIIEHLPNFKKMAQLIDPDFEGWDIQLTATTNKAAEAFASLTHEEVITIHSLLGLRVQTDWKTRKTSLFAQHGGKEQHGKLIFIDEASYIDDNLLKYILRLTSSSKLVFLGDPAQLTPVGYNTLPVFTKGFPGVQLTEVVRQAKGNPIIELSTQFRHWVNTGTPFQFSPDGVHTRWMDRNDFNAAMQAEFSAPSWTHKQSKFLAWTNKCCIAHNHKINEWVTGTPEFDVGDYAVCNSFLPDRDYPIKADQTVLITEKTPSHQYGMSGYDIELDRKRTVFMPETMAMRKQALKHARKAEDYAQVAVIDEHWADLRSLYACTVNKAQGSTYRKVFIDLDDISRCRDNNQIARMLYVAVSRASDEVIFTGDLV